MSIFPRVFPHGSELRPRFRSGWILRSEAGRLLVACAVIASASNARAQEQVDSEFSVQRFSPAAGPRNLISTRTVRSTGEMSFSAELLANYAYKPFVIERCDPGDDASGAPATSCEGAPVEEVPVVENLLTGDLMVTLSPLSLLQLSLRAPITWVKGVGLNPDGTSPESGTSATALGDLEFEGKARLFGDADTPLAGGIAAFVTAPTGSATAEGEYVGDSSVGIGGRAILDGRQGPLFWGMNLGGVWRESGSVGESEIGPEFRYSAGAGFQVSPLLAVMADAFGSTKFSGDTGTNALELDAALRISPLDSSIFVTAGAGAGLVEGVGVPKLRGFVGFAYIAESSDKDDDAIEDAVDQCPTDPEDRDAFQDSDGCPDLDNDLDTILDADDKCPAAEEDRDDFQDGDGCPEPDNDKDSVPDVGDVCPTQAETKNGYKDEDGCPDVADTDEDGVANDRDKCQNEAEDTDGFEDLDGCPDPDNDADGVPDNDDECVEQPETINEYQDEDGCPDEKPKGWRPPRP